VDATGGRRTFRSGDEVLKEAIHRGSPGKQYAEGKTQSKGDGGSGGLCRNRARRMSKKNFGGGKGEEPYIGKKEEVTYGVAFGDSLSAK